MMEPSELDIERSFESPQGDDAAKSPQGDASQSDRQASNAGVLGKEKDRG